MIEALRNIGFPSQVLLACWMLFLLIALTAFAKKKAYAPVFLFVSAVCIAGAFALFSPYLYLWDEQFHALVAKNMSRNPLVPKLYRHHPDFAGNWETVMWLHTEIWMHKQPLFTWQMALSVKLFGTNVFAVRLPSVIFHGILTLSVLRIGTLAMNRKTGIVGALLVMHSSFLLGMISGRVGTDHNDYIFLCYVTLSIWAWFEWDSSQKQKWLYWIGIFAGCAVLTKWLVGLLVFAGWGIVILSRLKRKNLVTQVKPFFISLGICVLVFLPWQIYTLLRFPAEAGREMAYNSEHVFQAVEGHKGSAWFHYEQLTSLYFYAEHFAICFVIALPFLIFGRVRRDHKIYLLTTISVIYIFFTAVKTKMPAFPAPAYAAVLLTIAFAVTEATRLIPSRWMGKTYLAVLTVTLLVWISRPLANLYDYGFHRNELADGQNQTMRHAMHQIKTLGTNDEKRIVFGVDYYPFAHITWMFFNDELAYPFVPEQEAVDQLEKAGYKVFILPKDAKQ